MPERPRQALQAARESRSALKGWGWGLDGIRASFGLPDKIGREERPEPHDQSGKYWVSDQMREATRLSRRS